MIVHPGGCLCGAVRYETRSYPVRVTICHCRFCQRATGSAYMVEPIFRNEDLRIMSGSPSLYELRSEGSGKVVRVHFCSACGTKLYLSFERFPDVCGVYAGTFDDPSWFEVGPGNAKHIFIEKARPDTVIPPGIGVFGEHALSNEGVLREPKFFDEPHVVGHRRLQEGTKEP
jgi:hypothetical protein